VDSLAKDSGSTPAAGVFLEFAGGSAGALAGGGGGTITLTCFWLAQPARNVKESIKNAAHQARELASKTGWRWSGS